MEVIDQLQQATDDSEAVSPKSTTKESQVQEVVHLDDFSDGEQSELEVQSWHRRLRSNEAFKYFVTHGN